MRDARGFLERGGYRMPVHLLRNWWLVQDLVYVNALDRRCKRKDADGWSTTLTLTAWRAGPSNARPDARLAGSATNGVAGNSPKPTREVSLYQLLDL